MIRNNDVILFKDKELPNDNDIYKLGHFLPFFLFFVYFIAFDKLNQISITDYVNAILFVNRISGISYKQVNNNNNRDRDKVEQYLSINSINGIIFL